MIFEKQITDYHCVPACLRMLIPEAAELFTQEEIGYMINTNKDGTYIPDTKYFLKLFGYKLKKCSRKESQIIDYTDEDNEHHWSIVFKPFYSNWLCLYEPFDAKMVYIYEPYFEIHDFYKLEKI